MAAREKLIELINDGEICQRLRGAKKAKVAAKFEAVRKKAIEVIKTQGLLQDLDGGIIKIENGVMTKEAEGEEEGWSFVINEPRCNYCR